MECVRYGIINKWKDKECSVIRGEKFFSEMSKGIELWSMCKTNKLRE